MGKAALILVLASFLAAGAMYVSRDQSIMSRRVEEADYEAKVLARETAQSAFNIIVAEVKRDFDGYRGSIQDNDYGEGKYDISASDAAGGGVEVVARGKYGDYEYEITGLVDRSGSRLIDALTVDGPLDDFRLQDNAVISGIDTNLDGSSGVGPNVHAILSTSSSTFSYLNSVLQGIGGLLGVGSGDADLDIVNSEPMLDLDGLESAIRNFEGGALTAFEGNKTYNGGGLGSLNSPAILRVEGNLVLKGSFSGYGIVYVTGNLTMRDTARWNGIVLVNNPSESTHVLRDDASVYGAMIVRSAENVGDEVLDEDDEDRGLPGGHFDTDVFDRAGTDDYVYHQHKYDDVFNTKGVDLLSSGCGENQGGGLCWNNVFGSGNVGPIKIEFENEGYSLGTYKIRVGADLYTGATTSGFSLDVEDPSDITEFEVEFLTLMALRGTDPWTVWASTSSRDNSFMIRIYEMPNENGGNGNGNGNGNGRGDDDDDNGNGRGNDDDDDNGNGRGNGDDDDNGNGRGNDDDDDNGNGRGNDDDDDNGNGRGNDDDDDDGDDRGGRWWDNDDDLDFPGRFFTMNSSARSDDDDDDGGDCPWWQNCGENSNNGGSGTPVLIYELDVYHHTSGRNGSGMEGGDGNAGDYDWGEDGDGDGDDDDGNGSVQVCHVPPGNPDNRHTINVGLAAVAAHLGHGDQAGRCDGDVVTAAGDDIVVKVRHDARIIYSAAAIRPLDSLLEQLQMASQEIVVSRTAERPYKANTN